MHADKPAPGIEPEGEGSSASTVSNGCPTSKPKSRSKVKSDLEDGSLSLPVTHLKRTEAC